MTGIDWFGVLCLGLMMVVWAAFVWAWWGDRKD